MKKAFIRTLCIVLAISCMVGLCGCGESGNGKGGYKGEVIDLGGKEISIVTWSTSFVPDEKSTSEAVQEAYARMKEVEKLYNCKFIVNNMEASEISSAFTTAAMAGQSIGDIILMKTSMATAAYNNNLLLDLSQVFDFDKAPFYKPATNLLKDKDGKIYSFDIRDFHAIDNMVYFNKEVFDEVGIDVEEIYQLVEDGEWTVEKYDEIISKATIVENGETVVYGGFGTTSLESIQHWLEAYGAETVHIDENGKASSGVKDAQYKEALEFVRENNQKSYVLKPGNDDAWDLRLTSFYNGTLATTFGSPANREVFKESCNFEYGILPFPKTDYIDDYAYIKNYLNVYVMPKTYEKDLKTAKAIADMVTYFAFPEEAKSEAELKKELEAGFCDEQSVEIAYKAATSENFKLQNIYTIGLEKDFNSVAHKALNPALHGTATVAPAIASFADAWQSILDDYNSGIGK